jgi:Spy/CpxP family protein refolding chaperone
MKKTVVALGLVAVMVLGVAYAFAQGPGQGPGPGPRSGWGHEKWSSLPPEQQTKVQELRQKFNDETAQLRGTMLTKRLELQSLWGNSKADSKAILEKEKEFRSLQDQMKDKAVQFKLEVRKILTPEQLAEFGSGWGMGRGSGRAHGGYGMGWRMSRGHGMGFGEGCF